MTLPNGNGGSDKTAEIREDIERTRGDMSRTVNAIEERLSPAHLKEQVRSVKESVLGEYHEVKDHLKEDIGRELRTAKGRVEGEIRHAKTAVRDATVGRVEHMVHDARETVTDAGTSVLDTIKANPVPAALVAVGLGWLLVSSRSERSTGGERRMRRYRASGFEAGGDYSYGYGDGGGYGYAEGRDEDESFGRRMARGPRRVLAQGQNVAGRAVHGVEDGISNVKNRVVEGAGAVADRAGHLAHDVGDSVSHLAHEAGDRVNHLAHDARDAAMHLAGDARMRGRRVIRGAGRQVRRAEQTFEGTLRENPLAVGAVAIAIGAAIGLVLPHTRQEDQWMGQTKDRLVRRAQGVAGEAIHRVEESVGQLAQGVQGQQQQGGGQGQQAQGGGQGQGQSQKSEYKNGIGNGIAGRST